MILYTYQKLGHAIIIKYKPLKEYTEEIGAYYEFAKYLKWTSWIWCFPSLEDYNTELCLSYMEIPKSWVLWNLDVPAENIRWLYFQKQMDNARPMEENFAPDEATIRRTNDLPIALVKAPIKKEWTSRPTMGHGKLEANIRVNPRLINWMIEVKI